MSVNKVILVGNLGSDPEQKFTTSGVSLCNLRVATTESWSKDGAKHEQTEWHRVVVFGKLSEICAKYLKKGRQIYLEGRLQTKKYEKDGENRYSTEIVARDIKFLGSKTVNANDTEPTTRTPNTTPEPEQQLFADEDIPF